jgi:hypothetical protein
VGQRGQFKNRLFFYMKKEAKTINREQDFLRHRIVSAIKSGEFVSGRMSCIVLRCR